MHENHYYDERYERVLAQLTTTTTRLEDLCKKFEDFMERGAPRCASHSEKLKSTKTQLVGIYTWLTLISASLVGAFFGHIFR